MSMCSSSELPTEIQLEIFELVAEAFPGKATELALLAHRFQIWMERLIYENVVLNFPISRTSMFLRTIEARPPQFFASHVKKLYMTSIVSAEDAQKILDVCTGVTELTCWSSINLSDLQSYDRVSLPAAVYGAIFAAPSFSPWALTTLTHLDIVNPRPSQGPAIDWTVLEALPNITHLCIGELRAWEHFFLIPVIEELLLNSPTLQKVILITQDRDFKNAILEDIEDRRLVFAPSFHHPKDLTSYWQGVNRGEGDFWDSL
ncbi:hypothetical protein C8J56DRAFT_103638 [Mycena floridula]|nr:hypothetical protein C8J56DRAFT_103638 [Mycena floridula]